MENNVKENKMGTMSVPKLIVKMSLPMMVSMLVLATYNVVDSIFVSRISENALTAVSLVFPFQMVICAVAVGTAVGVNSLVARRLGEKNQEEANRAASNGMLLAVLDGALFFVLFALLSPALIRMYNPDPEIYEYAVTYLSWVAIPSIFSHVQVMCEKVLQATGNTLHAMLIQLVGAVFNLIFDPILIFGLFGFPKLGVAGAAIATVGGQLVGMALGLILIRRARSTISVNLRAYPLRKATVKSIYTVGVPSIFLQMVGSIMNVGLNSILYAFTPTAVSVLGVYFKLQSFVFMPVFGLNSGTMPIMGYNYGARNRKRIMQALKCGVVYALCIMLLGTALFQIGAAWFLGLFDASAQMLEIGVPALRIISLSFPLAAIIIMCSSLFQAIGNGKLSLFTSALRQLLVLLPVAYLLYKVAGLSAVWWAFPIAEAVAIIATLFMTYNVYKNSIEPLGA